MLLRPNSFLQIHYIFANKHDETSKDVPNETLNPRVAIIRISFYTLLLQITSNQIKRLVVVNHIINFEHK